MSKLSRAMDGFYGLDELSGGQTALHRLHPIAKTLVTLLFLIAVVSSPRMNLAALCPYCVYIFLYAAVAEIPGRAVFSRALVALPFVLLAGLSNILFDAAPALMLGGLAVSRGVLACLTLMLKTLLCVGSVVLLAATTRQSALFSAMQRLGAPRALTTTCMLCFRYIALLMDETAAMLAAYRLRAPKQKGVAMRDMGPFAGQLILRSYDRAGRVYRAMLLRGFDGGYAVSQARFDTVSGLYLGGMAAALALCRFVLIRVFR